MSANRLQVLQDMVARNPGDSFARYGLAMEYVNSGNLEQAAAEFGRLMIAHPEYAPAYYHGGQTLQKLGRLEAAREVYRKGIELASRTGDEHARSELEAALDLLGG